MKSPLLILAGIPDGDEDESLPLNEKPRTELISLVERLTEMTAQQARIISDLRFRLSRCEQSNTAETSNQK